METSKLYQKIFELKQKIGKISKDSNNPFFNSQYFDINELLENLEPLLTEKKILLIQPIQNGKVYSRLIDLETNETEESYLELPALNDPQKIGSVITYYRRYTLGSLFAIQAEDDDANKASGNTTKKDSNTKSTDKPKVDKWLGEKEFEEVKNLPPAKINGILKKYNGKPYTDGKIYNMKKDYRTQLTQLKTA